MKCFARVRNPRIFFPLTTSTSTITYTADIWTVCFRSSTTALTVCNRKKRMVDTMIGAAEDEIGISPTRAINE